MARFRDIYLAWLAERGLTPNTACPVLGIGRQASYDYAAGVSVPTKPRVAVVARGMKLPEDLVRAACDFDRPRLEKTRERLARNPVRANYHSKQVVGSDKDVSHTSGLS